MLWLPVDYLYFLRLQFNRAVRNELGGSVHYEGMRVFNPSPRAIAKDKGLLCGSGLARTVQKKAGNGGKIGDRGGTEISWFPPIPMEGKNVQELADELGQDPVDDARHGTGCRFGHAHSSRCRES